MVTEDYVSFEVAKLLKEKGFGVSCYGRYSVRSKEFHLDTTKPCNNGGISQYSAPTLQVAMKWLREEKGIAVVPILSSVLDNEKFLWDIEITVAKTNETYRQGWIYESYEQACEAAIKYCLESLI